MIFILGVSQRSGTNYLARVLQCHPDCGAPAAPVAEDHLLGPAPLLARYADEVTRRWHPDWGDPTPARVELELALGEGLVSFLESRTAQRCVVSKTPSVEHLSLYPRFFPDAPLILLVRDGRAVTESLVKGFHLSYESAIRTWRHGARAILNFEKQARSDAPDVRLSVVRYESLLDDLEGQVEKLLDFCRLDPTTFDFAEARSLPVLGSSFDRGGNRKVTWNPVQRTDAFDPTNRFASWGRARHSRFRWLAGREQDALGYADATSTNRRRPWPAYNLMLEAVWPLRKLGRSAFGRWWTWALAVRRSVKDRAGRSAP